MHFIVYQRKFNKVPLNDGNGINAKKPCERLLRILT